MGYSACFLGAMKAAAGRAKKPLPEDTTVQASVSFADREDNVGFTIVAALTAKIPGWSKEDTEALMKSAHDICPYSDLIRKQHDVELKAA
jgi:Ohr subfamily peroxiredoxin